MKQSILVVFCIGFGFMIAAVSRQTPAKEVRATRFVLCDDEGNDVATLSTHEGGTWLTMKVPDQVSAVQIGIFKDGRVEMESRGNNGSIRCAVNKDGFPAIYLYRKLQAATFALLPEGVFDFAVNDERGVRRAACRSGPTGTVLEGFDENGAVKWRVPGSS